MYAQALDDFLAGQGQGGWARLPFFHSGAAGGVVARVDARVQEGGSVLPAPSDVFKAMRLTTPEATKVVILGQDPYPTPGHANGLAFSYVGDGALPASLRNIFTELATDIGAPKRERGDLSDWARQGALLLNAALTVEAGAAGAHLTFGWQELAEQAVKSVSDQSAACVFILWGRKAALAARFVDADKHLVLTSAHPSPLSAHNGFFGSRPFSKANAWLAGRGIRQMNW